MEESLGLFDGISIIFIKIQIYYMDTYIYIINYIKIRGELIILILHAMMP